MQPVSWNEDMRVGVPALDEQHRQLLDMVGQVHDALAAGQNRDVVDPMLDQLIRRIQLHFGDEERHMHNIRYADFAAHRGEHEYLTRQVRDLRARLDSGPPSLAIDLMNFIATWLRNHIQVTDRQYALAPAGQR